jgi:acyl-CoA thioester hydrolase
MTTTERPKNGRADPNRRSAFLRFYRIETRWMDNDAFRNLNNVSYYSFFDTAVARCLLDSGYLDIARSPVIGVVAETKCRFFRPIAFPDVVHCGLRVAHAGKSSVRIEIGLFRNDEDVAAAEGHFVHVYVDRGTGRPVSMPARLHDLFLSLRRAGSVLPKPSAAGHAAPESRAHYARLFDNTTRWMDNDAYRHMNNVVYYSFLDTAIARLLFDGGLLNLHENAAIGLAAESQCSFFRPVAFPDVVLSGLRVAHVGRSSVRYEIALFRNDEDVASAQGHFVHVYVDPDSGRPVAMPNRLRALLESCRHGGGTHAPVACTRQITSAASSATNSDPSARTSRPHGRP